MKKTVSWSHGHDHDTMKRHRELENMNTVAATSQSNDSIISNRDNIMSKSKNTNTNTNTNTNASKEKQLTSPQVNSRIQQMIAMQKAQNATMRQLMSTGAGSNSPSGLRDLVKTSNSPAPKPAPVEVTVTGCSQTVASDAPPASTSTVSVRADSIKPPKFTGELTPRATGRGDGGIHYQYQCVSSNSTVVAGIHPGNGNGNPQQIQIKHKSIPTLRIPKLANVFSDSSSCDSPVSYNSVLDQNSTPSAVRERKFTQHQQQLQTVHSEEQIMLEQYSEDGTMEMQVGNQPPHIAQKFNWGTIGATENDIFQLQQQHHGYGSTGMRSYNTETDQSQREGEFTGHHLKNHVQNFIPHGTETKLPISSPSNYFSAERHDDPPAVSHTQHLFHYDGHGIVGAPPSSVHLHNYPNLDTYRNDPRDLDTDESYPPSHGHPPHRKRRRWTIPCHPFQCFYSSDQLGRSFGFAAIDGMLTGAGILSAGIGLGLLPNRSRSNEGDGSSDDMRTQWILIALTLAACLSDGVCMAVGHVWSTRLLAGSSFEQHKEELRNFETGRSDAKARLVDSLLLRGMLKIDAMSLADTLEGYPDLFVGALLGEGFSGVGAGGAGMIRVSSGSSQGQLANHRTNDAWDIPPPSYGPGEIRHGLKYESYSDFSDYQQDPVLKTFTDTVSDSRLEGLFMMISFGMFSVIPILIHTFLPEAMNYILRSANDLQVWNDDRPLHDSVQIVTCLGVISGVMFLLGAWKSHLYSSHWCLFGMETVGVLLICISTAYLIGWTCAGFINHRFKT